MDVKAVQKALWCCTHPGNCSSCPYDKDAGCLAGCLNDLLVDARKSLTPRILRLDEIHRGIAVWIEYKEKPSWLTGFGEITNYKPVTLAIGGASCGGARCFIDEFDCSFAVNDADYNIRWRAWTQEPTEEQRQEVQCG